MVVWLLSYRHVSIALDVCSAVCGVDKYGKLLYPGRVVTAIMCLRR